MSIRSVDAAGTLPKPLLLFLRINSGLTVLCLAVELLCAVRGLPARYVFPFFVGLPFFDFECFKQTFQHLHQADFFSTKQQFPFTYPGPAAVVYAAFYKAGEGALNLFLSVVSIALVALTAWFARSLMQRGVSRRVAAGYAMGVALLAFPFWFNFQRANIEFPVCLVVFAGLYALLAGRGYSAAACFGLAASLKLLPIIYLGLFLYRRQYRQVIVGLTVMAVATLLSLIYVGPSIAVAWHGISAGLQYFQQRYVLTAIPGSMGWDHSLLALFRTFTPVTRAEVTFYTALTAVVGLSLFFLKIIRLPLINQVLCLSLAAVWLAPVSFEYTLMSLYAAFAMLVMTSLKFGAKELNNVAPMFVMFAVLFSPLSEAIWHGVQYGGQVKCLLLGALFVFALVRPVCSEWDGIDQ